MWFKYHFRREFFALLWEVLKTYPWDHSYLLNIEKAKMLEMAKYFERSQIAEGWERRVKELRLCARLIEIMTDETELFHYNGDWNFVPSKTHPGCYEMEFSEDWEYVCDVKVNTKNIKRFVLDEKMIDYILNKDGLHQLYMIKARQLYYKIRLEREETWWD